MFQAIAAKEFAAVASKLKKSKSKDGNEMQHAKIVRRLPQISLEFRILKRALMFAPWAWTGDRGRRRQVVLHERPAKNEGWGR